MKAPLIFSLKTKFILIAAIIVALSSIMWGSWVWHNEKRHLFEKLEGDGKLLLTALKAPIINAMTYEEIGVIDDVDMLDNFVEEIVGSHQLPTTYAFIIDRDGKVLAHNDYGEFGKTYRDPLTLAALTGDDFMSKVAPEGRENGPVLDLALPLKVSGERWGALRVGLSMAPLERQLASLRVQVLTFSGLFFLLGTAIFYVVGHAISKPLQQLASAMADVNHETLEAKLLPQKRRDEIGLLQESFLDMLRRLQTSEQERQRAVAQMIRNEKLATIGKIVAGVAHEVNNPLAAISACIYNLEGNVPHELRRYTEILKSGVQRIETIVRQLTDFSQARALDLQPVSSSVFFKEAAGFAAMALKKLDVTLVSIDSCPPMVLQIDKGKLHQVVLNLILNAADAAPSDSAIEFLAYCHDDFYFLAVRDKGAGIPPEEKEKIFEIFYTTKPAGEGSGIGLAICRSIVEMHRGEIFFESSPGETTFIVKIPVDGGDVNGQA
ncbi:MAG: HAMP domain-containing protein [Geobacter sp.]|nr:HAMP domain-containing protein [Geobacter sp.]